MPEHTHDAREEWVGYLGMMRGFLPEGLCGNREDHERHIHKSASLGEFFCHADQSKRLPYAMERRKHNE